MRYADDCVLMFKSERSALRVKESITKYLEGKLKVKVNQEKTVVAYVTEIKFLGFGFYQNTKENKIKIAVHKKSKDKYRKRIKELTSRNSGKSYKQIATDLKRYITGWVNYYRIADMSYFLIDCDRWMRRRIRMIYWKRWKKVRTKFRNLIRCGIKRSKAWEWANTRKSYWRISNSFILNRALPNKVLGEHYLFAFNYYKSINL